MKTINALLIAKQNGGLGNEITKDTLMDAAEKLALHFRSGLWSDGRQGHAMLDASKKLYEMADKMENNA